MHADRIRGLMAPRASPSFQVKTQKVQSKDNPNLISLFVHALWSSIGAQKDFKCEMSKSSVELRPDNGQYRRYNVVITGVIITTPFIMTPRAFVCRLWWFA